MRLFIITFLWLSVSSLNGQRGNPHDFGARSNALSGISTTLQDQDALLGNFANLAFENKFHVIASTSRRFNLSELTTATIAGSIPLNKFGHIGLSFSNYGFESYREQRISIKYARKLFNNFAIAGHFDVNSLRIDELGSNNTLSFGISFSGRINDQMAYGISIFNPEKIEITKDTEVASAIRFGLNRKVNDKLTLFLDIEKIIDTPLNIIAGLEYMPSSDLFVRLGTSTNPGSISFGIGYRIAKALRIDGGSRYDTLLGFSPSASLSYSAERAGNNE